MLILRVLSHLRKCCVFEADEEPAEGAFVFAREAQRWEEDCRSRSCVEWWWYR